MTADDLRDLFAQALLDEPDRIVSADEDIARGRAVRSRRRRTRLAAGVLAVLAAGSLGLVVPDAFDDLREPGVEAAAPRYDQLPPFVPEPGLRFQAQTTADSPADDASREESAALSSAEGTSPAGMLTAVERALPGDVEFADGAAGQFVGRHRVAFSVERDGKPFTLRVWWQTGAWQPWLFRPCTEAVAAFDRTAVWDDCTQVGGPETLQWRVLGSPDPQRRVLAIDDTIAAVTVLWETAEDEPATRPRDVLSDDEADRIAQATWDVAEDSIMRLNGTGVPASAEIWSGFGMGYVDESWANVEAALTRVLGPVSRVRKEGFQPSELNRAADPSQWPQAVTASYRTATGGTVDLAIWDAGAVYGALCTDLLACDVWPGSRDYFRPLLMSPADAMGGTALGDQGQAFLVLDGFDGDAAALHRAAMEAVFSVLPDPS
ncbi:hypothetical protein [Jiangella rhizosphaerae]|uniref:Uncharacterized protein n=1 Tax=Jiangella rhizosphaerae TaxID=2293569 RepID=A0A418KTP9_9ACTN|nr:hypothetical protein [Jiangella rhizosphaerae]RIQ30195.1 hypothetical protein DY240_07445 [Jiangella rhizosphaerae]